MRMFPVWLSPDIYWYITQYVVLELPIYGETVSKDVIIYGNAALVVKTFEKFIF